MYDSQFFDFARLLDASVLPICGFESPKNETCLYSLTIDALC